jgi:hypothetical protein
MDKRRKAEAEEDEKLGLREEVPRTNFGLKSFGLTNFKTRRRECFGGGGMSLLIDSVGR